MSEKVSIVPEQVRFAFKYCGVTLICAINGFTPLLIPVNPVIFPVPLPIKPIAGIVFVQLYEVPVPVKLTAATCEPAHITWSIGSFTCGVGLTIIVTFSVAPTHVAPAFE